MKLFYSLSFSFLSYLSVNAQTVNVSAPCIPSTVTLSPAGTIDGKTYYETIGTVAGNSGTTIDIYWSAADNLWLLAFDGQAYYQNSCNFSNPPGTASNCPWTTVTGFPCTGGGGALSITGSAVSLPVNLISFTAAVVNDQVVLKWKTASEINNKNYEVQRSTDALSWTTIGMVNGSGSTSSEKSYQFTDDNPSVGKNYYRLIQYDNNGQKTYLKVVSVDYSLSPGKYFTLGGNPGNGVFTVNIYTQSPVELKVVDLAGNIIARKTAKQGANELNISHHPSGVYILQLIKENQVITEKLIKQ